MLHASPRRLTSVSPSNLLHFHHVSPFTSVSPTPCHSLRYKPIDSTTIINTFDHLLQSCFTIHQAKQIHSQIIHNGTTSSAFLAARLISVYAQFSSIHDAQSVFLHTPIDSKSNILLWNSILRANTQNVCFGKVLKLYSQMRNLGVKPDAFSFPLVLRACASMGDLKLCKTVHNHVVVSGFRFQLHVGNELVGMYGKHGCMESAAKVFDIMPFRTHISWNTMISGFSKNYDCDGAAEVYKRMEMEGFEPTVVTWTSLLSAHARCGRHGNVMELFNEMRRKGKQANAEAVSVVISVCADMYALSKGKEVHGYAITAGFGDYVFLNNSLISMYGKNKNIQDAELLFSEMRIKNLVSWNALMSSFAEGGLCDEAFKLFSHLEKSDELVMKPNVISWSIVIGAFASKERGDECLELFRKMLLAKVEPNAVTIASVLSICAELAALDLGREIHGHVLRGDIDKNILVGNGLTHMYTKCGSLKVGRLVFDRIKCKDLVSWNSMIVGYGMHGFGEEALISFHEMIRTGLKPDGITFVGILSACSHAGLVSEGRRLFDEMVGEYSVTPQMEHYACIVDLLGRAGLLQEASQIVKMMPFQPNICVWGALLNSCRMYKNTEVAEHTASQIFNLESDTTGSYMLLSNLYAASERWEDSAKVRMLAKTKGLKKTAGQSWIEVKKKAYIFSAGNTSQLGLEEVRDILKDLYLRMETEGYIPDKSCVLQDVGEEEKKQILYGHSEKLAIAFGHANIPLDMPIRVMKNLRVCGDCHNWTKFFSKMYNRQIIVRDGRRFHHFMNGLCSCKDYW